MASEWYATTGGINSPVLASNTNIDGVSSVLRHRGLMRNDMSELDRNLVELGDRMAELLASSCGCGERHQVCRLCTVSELWWAARRDKTRSDLKKLREELG